MFFGEIYCTGKLYKDGEFVFFRYGDELLCGLLVFESGSYFYVKRSSLKYCDLKFIKYEITPDPQCKNDKDSFIDVRTYTLIEGEPVHDNDKVIKETLSELDHCKFRRDYRTRLISPENVLFVRHLSMNRNKYNYFKLEKIP